MSGGIRYTCIFYFIFFQVTKQYAWITGDMGNVTDMTDEIRNLRFFASSKKQYALIASGTGNVTPWPMMFFISILFPSQKQYAWITSGMRNVTPWSMEFGTCVFFP